MDVFSGQERQDADAGCVFNFAAIEDALYVIGGKWKMKLIIALSDGRSKRFNELQRLLPGISARVLSNELKSLELNGFIERKVSEGQTVASIEYVPTSYAMTLKAVVKALWDWGVEHKKMITSKN